MSQSMFVYCYVYGNKFCYVISKGLLGVAFVVEIVGVEELVAAVTVEVLKHIAKDTEVLINR